MKKIINRFFIFAGIVVFSLILYSGIRIYFSLFWDRGRTKEFSAQAKRGQIIVLALEKFKSDSGYYPDSLSRLFPQYLESFPKLPNYLKNIKWEYRKNHNDKPYSLRFYMGKGGVEYYPPHWYGNNEGSRKIILSNDFATN
jgi:hypothetical protein